MTTQATLTYKRQNKRVRYFQRALRLHSGKTVVKVIELGTVRDLSERASPGKVRKAARIVRVSGLSATMRVMLRSAGQASHDWRALGAESLLDRINDPQLTPRNREMAVLFAETTFFDDSLRARLLAELATFIARHRFTRNRNEITAVAAAIRKYAMNMDVSHFEVYAGWLLPSETETLSSRVELELVKALSWRLSYLPVPSPAKFPGLTTALADIGIAYLSPRLIVQKNYAALALQAINALAILQSLSGDRTTIGAMLDRVSALRLDWFSELLDDRLHESYEAISQHDAQLAERLRQFVDDKR